MAHSLSWTVADLECLAVDETKRYEIIDGELYVHQPNWHHQVVCVRVSGGLDRWSFVTGLGVANAAPGLIFAVDEAVAPDIVWISNERLASALGADGKLHSAPDLVVEVLSPGQANHQRDREVKLKLYARRGVREYWIVNWPLRQVEVYRRNDLTLQLVATLFGSDVLDSPVLPGFVLSLNELFSGLPSSES